MNWEITAIVWFVIACIMLISRARDSREISRRIREIDRILDEEMNRKDVP